jgi:PAS domain-containing protein
VIQPERIRILFVEDNRADVELELRELLRSGLAVQHRAVERREDFLRELAEFRPDIILSDFSMPSFDGMSALAIARETAPGIPFLFVSGTIGEEHAIRALRDGAADYVLKTNLIRLPPAVERALERARELAAKREMERVLRESELKYRSLVDAMNEGLGVQDRNGTISFMNKRACEMLGYEAQELLGRPVASLFDEENRQFCTSRWRDG